MKNTFLFFYFPHLLKILHASYQVLTSAVDSLEGEMGLRAVNDRLMLTERAFVASEGLIGRPWFRHLVRGI